MQHRRSEWCSSQIRKFGHVLFQVQLLDVFLFFFFCIQNCRTYLSIAGPGIAKDQNEDSVGLYMQSEFIKYSGGALHKRNMASGQLHARQIHTAQPEGADK